MHYIDMFFCGPISATPLRFWTIIYNMGPVTLPAISDANLSREVIPSTEINPRLARVYEALEVLCQEFEKLYDIKLDRPTVRLLTEHELDDYVSRGGPMWMRNKVNLSEGQSIMLNPHISENDWLEILPHEIGHAALNAAGFEVDPYLPHGFMGPRRVLHELVADTFETHGEAILRDHRLIGNCVTRFFSGFISPWSPLISFMQDSKVTMKEILTNPGAILESHKKYFFPRQYEG